MSNKFTKTRLHPKSLFTWSHRVRPEAIEVLLKTCAFVVKRVAPGGGDGCRKGQVSWKKHGSVQKAWEAARAAANWPED